MKIRGNDKHGSGAYLASRGSRLHHAIDFETSVGEEIGSFCSGKITKIGYPYNPADKKKGHLRYIQVTDKNGIDVRVFYCQPKMAVTVGNIICKGEIIGYSQDLTKIYPGIIQHLHIEAKKDGEVLNLMEYFINSLT